MDFFVTVKNGSARLGRLHLAHGIVDTPAFMPIGTYGAVKGILPGEIEAAGAQMILANTFHLWERPGTEIIALHQGLHGFMQWSKPILTDSGGFQVMSLAALRKINDEGVMFQSPINGERRFLTPEESMRIQACLNSDIVMVLDECPPYAATFEAVEKAVQRSTEWAKRSKKAHGDNPNMLFAIVQGGVYPALRERSARALLETGFDGYAIGGLAVGEPKEAMFDTLEQTMVFLPEERPRYLMGVGTPEDLVRAVLLGVDLFDCVLPTRNGRNGWLYIHEGIVKIRNTVYRTDTRVVDPHCNCPLCGGFSRAYLHHLFRINEMLGARLASLHNIYFYQKLMRKIRHAIQHGIFFTLRQNFSLQSMIEYLLFEEGETDVDC